VARGVNWNVVGGKGRGVGGRNMFFGKTWWKIFITTIGNCEEKKRKGEINTEGGE